jgi:hypothetical protein
MALKPKVAFYKEYILTYKIYFRPIRNFIHIVFILNMLVILTSTNVAKFRISTEFVFIFPSLLSSIFYINCVFTFFKFSLCKKSV